MGSCCSQSLIAGSAFNGTATQPTPSGWASSSTESTNSSGLTTLRRGELYDFGSFNGITCVGILRTPSVLSRFGDWNYSLYSDYSYVIHSFISMIRLFGSLYKGSNYLHTD